MRSREVEGEAHAALHAHARVHRPLRRDLVGRALAQEATLTRVHTLGVLADHGEIDVGMPRVGGCGERPQVHVEVELEPQAEQDSPLDDATTLAGRGADRAEHDRVELADLLEVGVGQHRTVARVALPTEVERHALVRDARPRRRTSRLPP